MSTDAISRVSWPAVVAAFTEFFDGMGDVRVSEDTVSFEAPETGLSVGRDGSSRSFMPLHGLTLTWDTVVFDKERFEVRLVGSQATYSYVVPPNLRPRT